MGRNLQEERLQQQCYTWLHNSLPALRGRVFMIHNNPRDSHEGAKLLGMGLVAGVADMCYIKDGGQAVFLEFKTPRGRQSKAQKEFEAAVTGAGAFYIIVRSFQEFKYIFHDHTRQQASAV